MSPEQQQPQQPQVTPPQWQFVPEQGQQQPHPNNEMAQSFQDDGTHINWSASEFVAYQKTAGWYLLMITAVAALAALILVLTQDLISTVSIVLIGILFIVFASRKPRTLNYQINNDGIRVGDKMYAFSTLKSFAVIDEGNLHSIMLLPTQRFLPSVSIYFDPQEEQKIVEILGSYLPHENRKQDAIDRFMHRIRF